MSILRKAFAAVFSVVPILSAGAAAAEDFTSQYTSTKNCKKLRVSKAAEGDWAVRACPGIGGYRVAVSEDDLRTTVSIGRTLKAADDEPAASQRFGPFNYIGDRMEWRSVKGKPPFAAILRWMIADNEALDKNSRPTSVPVLVVIKLPPGPVCHVAYIDAKSNPDANALARKVAGETARGFNCDEKPTIVGAQGRGAVLAAPTEND
jgi:hypothetical protein